MNPTEIRIKSDDELKESLVGLRKEAFNLRFQRASGQLENTTRMRGIRRDIARIKTVLTERKAGGAPRAAAGAAEPGRKAAPTKKAKTAGGLARGPSATTKRKAKSA